MAALPNLPNTQFRYTWFRFEMIQPNAIVQFRSICVQQHFPMRYDGVRLHRMKVFSVKTDRNGRDLVFYQKRYTYLENGSMWQIAAAQIQ